MDHIGFGGPLHAFSLHFGVSMQWLAHTLDALINAGRQPLDALINGSAHLTDALINR
jgi:hypothetical protein